MFPFLRPAEKKLIQHDYVSMLKSEGSAVTVKYLTPLIPTADSDPDPVYKFDRRTTAAAEQSLAGVKCFMQIVHPLQLKLLSFGIVQAGDAIFYFLDNLNLLEPIAGKPAIPETMYFIDPYSGSWSPTLGDVGPLKRYLAMVLNNSAIAQVVPCALKK